jgi:hypothetical protein
LARRRQPWLVHAYLYAVVAADGATRTEYLDRAYRLARAF